MPNPVFGSPYRSALFISTYPFPILKSLTFINGIFFYLQSGVKRLPPFGMLKGAHDGSKGQFRFLQIARSAQLFLRNMIFYLFSFVVIVMSLLLVYDMKKPRRYPPGEIIRYNFVIFFKNLKLSLLSHAKFLIPLECMSKFKFLINLHKWDVY